MSESKPRWSSKDDSWKPVASGGPVSSDECVTIRDLIDSLNIADALYLSESKDESLPMPVRAAALGACSAVASLVNAMTKGRGWKEDTDEIHIEWADMKYAIEKFHSEWLEEGW